MAMVTFVQLPAGAAPAELMTSPAGAVSSEAPKAAPLSAGDASVSTQTGALQYSYPIPVPPGRHGMKPALSLTYSSQAPIYGGIAAGWQLPIPIISLDTSNGRLVGPKTYASSMGGGRPLVAVSETLPSGMDGAYRAQNDATFTRYLHQVPSAPSRWIAQTTDGVTYYFGAPSHTGKCNVGDDYAPLTTMFDSFGNAVDYYYEEVVPGECRISRISWGQNTMNGSNLQEFARVTFVYAMTPYAPCNGVPVGSDTNYRSGIKRVSGASQLDSISVTAFEPGLSGSPEHTRTIAIAYNDNDASCTNKYAPYRSLKSITESAGITNSPNSPVVTLPPVTFTYGDPTPAATPTQTAVPWHNAWGGNNLYGALMWGQRFKTGGQWPTVEAMMVDVDGDGLIDRVTNDSYVDGVHAASCAANWERNLGAGRGFQDIDPKTNQRYRINLPTLKWASTGFDGGPFAGSNGNTDELCALNYQQTHYVNSSYVNGVEVGCTGASCPATGYCSGSMYGMDCGAVGGISPTILAYRWIDVDDDGKVDLVASIAQGGEGVYNLAQGNKPGAPPEPTIFGDLSRFPCPSSPYNDGDITTNKYTMCHGMYPWFVFLNKGGTFGAVPDKVLYQPAPLETTNGDSSVTGPVTGQFEGNFDLDGDGHGDVATAGPTWSLFRGLRDLTMNQQTAFQPAVGFGAGPSDSTISQTSLTVFGVSQPMSSSGLFDLNGDGLPDHWSGTSSSVNVEMNNGVSFVQVDAVSARRPGNDSLALTTDAFGNACRNEGNFVDDCSRVDISRTVDVDNDGRPDLVQLSGFCAVHRRTTDRTTIARTFGRCITNADCAQGSCVGGSLTPQVFFNVGGQFTSSSTAAGDSVALDHEMDVSSELLQGAGFGTNSFTWEVRSDMIDLDGDGVAEGVDFTPNGTFYVSKVTAPTAPPRLLVSISNNHGLIATASYLALSDTTAVTQSPTTGESSPRTQWVVRSLKTVDLYDGLSFGATTTNDYKNPVY
ncbi:MAG: SpvB/TcaC N-terminal domain-containing protein, partial [Kofleriaceae bacterium]